jgi:hypothetical protein
VRILAVLLAAGCASAATRRAPLENKPAEHAALNTTPAWLDATRLENRPGPFDGQAVPPGTPFVMVAFATESDDCGTRLALKDDRGWWISKWTVGCGTNGPELGELRVVGDMLVVPITQHMEEAFAWTTELVVLCGVGPSRTPSCTAPLVESYYETREADHQPGTPPIVEADWKIAVDIEPGWLFVPEHGNGELADSQIVPRPGRWPIVFP